MLETLRAWIFKIIGASVLSSVALSVTLSPKMKRVVSLCCSFLAAAVLLSPLAGISGDTFSLSGLNESALLRTSVLEERNAELRASIIASDCEAYILNKAAELGAQVSVKVTLAEDGAPFSCEVMSDSGGAVKFALSETIAKDLGIPLSRQYWG